VLISEVLGIHISCIITTITITTTIIIIVVSCIGPKAFISLGYFISVFWGLIVDMEDAGTPAAPAVPDNQNRWSRSPDMTTAVPSLCHLFVDGSGGGMAHIAHPDCIDDNASPCPGETVLGYEYWYKCSTCDVAIKVTILDYQIPSSYRVFCCRCWENWTGEPFEQLNLDVTKGPILWMAPEDLFMTVWWSLVLNLESQ